MKSTHVTSSSQKDYDHQYDPSYQAGHKTSYYSSCHQPQFGSRDIRYHPSATQTREESEREEKERRGP